MRVPSVSLAFHTQGQPVLHGFCKEATRFLNSSALSMNGEFASPPLSELERFICETTQHNTAIPASKVAKP